jgi:hypothetical protein
MAVPVLVHDESIPIFLLGSDVIYGRLVIDRGMFLSFPDDKYPPIPIIYELVQRMVKSVDQCQIAPRSSAIIKVNVTDNARITGKEVLLTPVTHCVKKIHPYKGTTFMEDESPIRNTVSIIDSDGNSFVLVENDTDDILTILPDYEIAQAELIHDKEGNVNLVNYEIDQEKTESLSKDGKWPINALKNELHDKIPSNVIVQWDKLELQNKNCDEDDSTLVNEHKAYYVHDKEERKHLLDGTGEGFPVPPAADSIHPDEIIDPDPEAWLKNVEHEHLSDTDWEKLKAVLINNKEAFAKSKTEIGCCNYFKVDLPLKPGTGYLYNKPRPLPFKHREMAAETISELLAKGVIRPSNSPHATNIVCVKKKTMKIANQANFLTIETANLSAGLALTTSHEKLIFDGKESQVNYGPGIEKKFTVKWSADEQTMTVNSISYQGQVIHYVTEVWKLSNDGKSISVQANAKSNVWDEERSWKTEFEKTN